MMTYPGDSTAFPSAFRSKAYKRRAKHPHLSDPNSSKRLKTPAPNPVDNEPEKDCSKAQLIYNKMLADLALDYYNNKNDTRFEVVEDKSLRSSPFTDSSGSWTHCSFNAKDASSINKFFVELKCGHPFPAVTTCKILIDGETKDGCDYCHISTVTHPVVGYKGDAMKIVEKDKYSGFRVQEPTYHPTAPNFNPAAWSKRNHIRQSRIAQHALDRYNKTNDTKVVLADDHYINIYCLPGDWIHMSFHVIDSSVVKPFFAEIKYYKFSEPCVTVCKILEGETKQGCEICRVNRVTHPIVGYRGDLPAVTEHSEKDKDTCYKMYYCEELLG